jgi:single-stranded-DNA-specific exonuclease
MKDQSPVRDVSAFLGVEQSLTGRAWRLAPHEDRIAAAISQRLDLPELAGRVLAARGISIADADSHLDPKLRTLLPDPLHLLDMKKGADRLAKAVMDGETIGIWGDYDVDGATASALLLRFLTAAGGLTELYIPDRMKEGYGPNAPALLRLREGGVGLVVTVDCGILSFEPLAAARAAGLDVIVVDHHQAAPALPEAFAVINPNRLDERSPHTHMAAVGLAFLLVIATNRVLQDRGWYGADRKMPNPIDWLDIVALGTVCDMVSLTGINRALVAQGLKVAALRKNPGLVALSDVAGIAERPSTYHLAFLLGPRVNAGGRVGLSELGARLLATDDPAEARSLAQKLDEHNKTRQQLEAAVLMEAIEQVESHPSDHAGLVMAHGENWHPGVVGIIAGRLKERYHLPACAVAVMGGEGRGSGRSVPGFDLGAAVIAAKQAGLLIKGGGHAMAAGFTVAESKIADLHAFLSERLLAGQESGPAVPSLVLDGALDVGGATIDLVEIIAKLGPFGSGNPEPRFALMGARVMGARVVGSGHVSCQLGGAGSQRLKAIAFRAADSELGQALLANDGTPMHLAGTLRLDVWQGITKVQLTIEDAAPAR